MDAHTTENEPWPRGARIETMALVLEARHGVLASDVANFFALFHGTKGNFQRQAAWTDVSLHLQKRQSVRNASVMGKPSKRAEAGLGLH